MAKTPTGKSGGGKTPTGKNTSGRGQRDLKVKVKTARGRKLSSTRWLQRQLNDPYVKRAQAEGYRGRAAYKIMELDDKYRFLVPGARVVEVAEAKGDRVRLGGLGLAGGLRLSHLVRDLDPPPGALFRHRRSGYRARRFSGRTPRGQESDVVSADS